MADISKIKLPNGDEYNLKDSNLNGHSVHKDVPANAVFTDTTYSIATQTNDGLMSYTDKRKIDTIFQVASYNQAEECIYLNVSASRVTIIIEKANITSAGVLTSASSWDIHAISVSPGEILQTITSSWADGLLYAFFTDAPVMGSKSYDGSRVVISGSTVANNVTVPAGCKWIVIRPNHGGTATVI